MPLVCLLRVIMLRCDISCRQRRAVDTITSATVDELILAPDDAAPDDGIMAAFTAAPRRHYSRYDDEHYCLR